jgi:hypothetical protein
LAVCGLVHEARGAEIIKWDLGNSNIKYKELEIERLSNEMSLFDMTTKLKNDGHVGDQKVLEGISFQESDAEFAPTAESIKNSRKHRTGGRRFTVSQILMEGSSGWPLASCF